MLNLAQVFIGAIIGIVFAFAALFFKIRPKCKNCDELRANLGYAKGLLEAQERAHKIAIDQVVSNSMREKGLVLDESNHLRQLCDRLLISQGVRRAPAPSTPKPKDPGEVQEEKQIAGALERGGEAFGVE